jgi:hypothetical protein
LKKRKKKLEVTQKWVMTICMLCSLYDIFVYLDIAFFVYFKKKKILFWPLVYGWLELSSIFCLDLYFMGLSRPHAPTSCPRSQVSQVNHDFGLDQVNVL